MGLFGRGLRLLECGGYGNGTTFHRNGMLCRTNGSVLGRQGIVVGAAIDLANSGCIVGMIALRTA
jgi:hypothetical protein